MTRAERIESALIAAVERHRDALNAAVGVSSLRVDVKFDRSTGMPVKVIVYPEMEVFVTTTKVSEYVFAT